MRKDEEAQCGRPGFPSCLFSRPAVWPQATPFLSVCPSFLTCKRKRSKLMASNSFLPSSLALSFLTSMSQKFSHFKTPNLQPLWEGMGLSGDPQKFTCPFHATTASQSADVASGPLELQSSTHRTDSHWCFQGNLGRGRGRWWHCAQLLRKGLWPESEWAIR